MCICLRWLSMSRPSCMSDTTCSRYGFSAIRLLRQNFQTAFCFNYFCLFLSISYCDSCWIISSLLQLRKTIQQNWCCLHITCKSYNPTHTITPFTVSLVYVHFKTPLWAPIRNPVSKKAFLQPDFSYLSLYSQFYNPCKYTIEALLAQEMKLIQTIFVIEFALPECI